MKHTNFKKWTLGFFAAVALSTTLIACDNKKNDDQVVVGTYQNCTNCAGIVYGQEFLRTTSQGSNGYVQMQMALVYNGATNGYAGYYPPFAYYQGPVAVTGTMNIVSNTNFGYCGAIPAGAYSITTVQAGNWTNSGILTNLRMLAVGPASMVITVTQGQIASPQQRDAGGNLSLTQRLFANVVIESVNNVSCGMGSLLVQ